MSGGWAGSDRRSRLPPDWEKLREETLQAAGGRCEWRFPNGGRCRAAATDVDHIVAGDDHTRRQALCTQHHRIKSSREGNAAKAAKKAQGKRPPPLHPGFIRRNP